MTRAYYDTKPPKLEAVGNGNYLYRWDIQEEVSHEIMQEGKEEPVSSVKKVQYSCREVTIHGKPEYGKCVEAVIRSDYSAEAELALINQFNAYQQGVLSDAGVVSEYEEYLAFVSSVKSMVKEDLEIDPGTPKTASAPRMADIAKLLMLTVNTMSLTDNDALSVKSVYPEWETLIGKEVCNVTAGCGKSSSSTPYRNNGDREQVLKACTRKSRRRTSGALTIRYRTITTWNWRRVSITLKMDVLTDVHVLRKCRSMRT